MDNNETVFVCRNKAAVTKWAQKWIGTTPRTIVNLNEVPNTNVLTNTNSILSLSEIGDSVHPRFSKQLQKLQKDYTDAFEKSYHQAKEDGVWKIFLKDDAVVAH